MSKRFALALAVVVFALPSIAMSAPITFDEVALGTTDPTISGVRFQAGDPAATNDTFVSDDLSPGDPYLASGFDDGAGISPGLYDTFIGMSLASGQKFRSVSFQILSEFTLPVGTQLTLQGLLAGSVVESLVLPIVEDPNAHVYRSMSLSFANGADQLRIFDDLDVNGFGEPFHIDNFAFQQLNGVPEPGSLLLLAAGLGGVGWVARRRKAGGECRDTTPMTPGRATMRATAMQPRRRSSLRVLVWLLLVLAQAAWADPLIVRVQPSGDTFSTAYALAGESRTLLGNVEGGVAPYQYRWEFSDGGTSGFSPVTDPGFISTAHAFANAGTHWARLTVMDSAGASETAQITLLVVPTSSDSLRRKVNSAVDNGLRWQYQQRRSDANGTYWSSSDFPVADTGMALLALENHGHNLQSPDTDIYKKPVQQAVRWLLNNAHDADLDDNQCAVGDVEEGDGDADDDNKGIYFTATRELLYVYSIAMLALVNSADEDFAKNRYIVSTTDPNRFVNGMTLWDVIVDTKDFMAWAQNSGLAGGRSCGLVQQGRGGWRYINNDSSSDNSVTQWPVLALAEAESRWHIRVKSQIKSELDAWLLYSQYSSSDLLDGYFGYLGPGEWSWIPNFGRAGAGLIMLEYVGQRPTDSRVTRTLAAASRIWNQPGWANLSNVPLAVNWDGNLGNLYAMYAFYKGMKVLELTSLDGRPWEQLYQQYLVSIQASGGYWQDCCWFSGSIGFATSTALAILAPEVTGLPPLADAGGPYPDVSAGQVVSLNGGASSHNDPARRLVKWEWDFNAADGLWWENKPAPGATEGAVGITASVSYPDQGPSTTYTVTLRVTDDGDPVQHDTDTATVTVKSGNVAPVALTNGPWSGVPNQPIVFSAASSYDANSCTDSGNPSCLGDSIVSFEWDLDGDGAYNEANGDDGTPDSSDRRIVRKAFPEPISLPVTLRVTDERGLQGTSSALVNIVSIALVFGSDYNTCFRQRIDRYTERRGLGVLFKNLGTGTATNVVMTLRQTPSNATVLKGATALGTMNAGQTKWTACDAGAMNADIEVKVDRRILPTGEWRWRAEFDVNGRHYLVDNIPPLAP